MNITATMKREKRPGEGVFREIYFHVAYAECRIIVRQNGYHTFKEDIGLCYSWNVSTILAGDLFVKRTETDDFGNITDLLNDCRKLMMAWDLQHDEVIQEDDFSQDHQLSIRRLKFLGKYFGE